MILIDNWKAEATRLWSFHLIIFWTALQGAVGALSAFTGYIDPWTFLALSIIGNVTIGLARFLKQPGVD